MSTLDRVLVVNKVLGTVAGPGFARTGDVVNMMPKNDGPDALIARGCLNTQDGGGGLFVWRSDSTDSDDGGTVLLPNALVQEKGIEPKAGRWHRLYTGALDIRWFGAQISDNNSSPDSTTAIKNAIFAVTHGGPAAYAEIFVPPGEFRAQIALPRLDDNALGFTIRGTGIRSSQITWGGAGPVVDFLAPDDSDAMNYRFHSIMFRHKALGGTAFRHKPNGKGRLKYPTFVDVGFFSPGVLEGENQPVAELRSMYNARLDRVWFSGSAGILMAGSRNFMTAGRTFLDYEQTDGIVLESCSETVIDGPRVDGLAGKSGDGIRLANSSNITIRNASFEGKDGRSCIRIENSSNITLDNCNMGGGPRAYVQSASSDTNTSSTTRTATFSSAQKAGNANIVAIGVVLINTAVSSVTDSRGNSYSRITSKANGSVSNLEIWAATNIAAATAGSNTVTVTLSSANTYWAIGVLEYGWVSSVDVFAQDVGSGTSANSGSATTTAEGDVVIGAYISSSTDAGGAGSGFAQRIFTSNNHLQVEDMVAGSAGSYSAINPMSASGDWNEAMVALKRDWVALKRDWAALWITGNSENIRIEGGRINVHDITGVRIDADARSIRGKGIEFPQSSEAAMGSFLDVHKSASDVRIESFTGTDARVEFAQTVGDALKALTPTVLLRRWEDGARVAGPVTIVDIKQGNDPDGTSSSGPVSRGRRVVLFLSGGQVTVASGGASRIRLSTGVAWTPPGDAMIELVFDGTLWYELGRNG